MSLGPSTNILALRSQMDRLLRERGRLSILLNFANKIIDETETLLTTLDHDNPSVQSISDRINHYRKFLKTETKE